MGYDCVSLNTLRYPASEFRFWKSGDGFSTGFDTEKWLAAKKRWGASENQLKVVEHR